MAGAVDVIGAATLEELEQKVSDWYAEAATAHAGIWSTMTAGAAGVVVGMFLALALVATTR